MDGIISGIIITVSVLAALFLLFLLCWLILWKGKCRKTKYSHNITIQNPGREILAVVSSSSGPGPTTSVQEVPNSAHTSLKQTVPPFPRPITTLAANRQLEAWEIHPRPAVFYPHPYSFRQSDSTISNSPLFLSQLNLPEEQGGITYFDRRNMFPVQSERVIRAFPPNPPYTTGGPPSYQHTMALQQLRNSIR